MSKEENSPPYFSIVIPIYNTEKYITRCLDSIITQSVTLEVIVVDDCSQDESAVIVQSYCDKYCYIRLFRHLNNKGQGAARNLGVSHARGKYILFADSDDWYEPNALKRLKADISNNRDPDLLIFSYYIRNINSEKIGHHKYIKSNPGVFTGADVLEKVVAGKINPSPWNKAYKLEFWSKHEFKFSEYMSHDDFALIPYVISQASKCIMLKNRLYNYLVHDESITNTVSDRRILSSTKSVKELRNNFLKEGGLSGISESDFQKIAYNHYYDSFKTRKTLCTDEQIRCWINNIVEYGREYNITHEFILNYSAPRKLYVSFVKEIQKRKIDIDLYNGFDGNIESELKELVATESKTSNKSVGAKFLQSVKRFIGGLVRFYR